MKNLILIFTLMGFLLFITSCENPRLSDAAWDGCNLIEAYQSSPDESDFVNHQVYLTIHARFKEVLDSENFELEQVHEKMKEKNECNYSLEELKEAYYAIHLMSE